MRRLAAWSLALATLSEAHGALGAPPPSSSSSSSSSSLEEALLGGFGSTGDHLGLGPAVAFEVGGRRQLRTLSLGLGLRAQYERYSRGGAGVCSPSPAPLAGPCVGAKGTATAAAPYPYAFGETLFTFELPITVRLGASAGTILPYLGVAPGVAYDRSDVTAATASASFTALRTEARFSIHAFVGTQLRVGPGGFFFEWGARASPAERRAEGDSHLATFEGAIGYRLTI